MAYIEREAAVHVLMNRGRYLTKDLVMDAAYEVSKIPAADVAPVVRGEWISHEGYDECNLCHNKSIYGHNYCPNCGAHMKDGE
jgi:hypothetical protein